jgi:hypothetical protein
MPALTTQDREDIRSEHYPQRKTPDSCICGGEYPCDTLKLLDMLDAAEAKVALVEAIVAAILCDHTWVYVEDEYGSLGDGGSYEAYKCSNCNRKSYVQMADR